MMRKIEPVYTRRIYAVTNRYIKQSIADAQDSYGKGQNRLFNKYKEDTAAIVKFYAQKVITVFGKEQLAKHKCARKALEKKAAESYVDLIMQRYLIIYGATQVKLITETTRDELVETLANTKQTPKELEDRIKKLRNMTVFRAATIARTETHNASQYAVTEIARELEADTGTRFVKAWVAAQDERTRPGHAEQDPDNYIGMSELFEVPLYEGNNLVAVELMAYPGDANASAGNLCNCRCVLVTEEAEFV
jgi:hypothetical protein